MRISFNPERHGDVLSFVDHAQLQPQAIVDAICRLVRSHPLFREWRQKVGQCSKCYRFVPVWPETSSTPSLLDHHRIKNPDGDRPYEIECPGSWTKNPRSHAEAIGLNDVGLRMMFEELSYAIERLAPGQL